jgi:hypothetical protein
MPHAFFVNDHRQTYKDLLHDEAGPSSLRTPHFLLASFKPRPFAP